MDEIKLYFEYNKITEEKIDYIREAEYIRIYIDLNFQINN